MKSKALLLAGLMAYGLLLGCEVGSPNTVVASTSSGNFSGLYTNPNGGDMVQKPYRRRHHLAHHQPNGHRASSVG